jgi:RNA polymerase sigma factor FliA
VDACSQVGEDHADEHALWERYRRDPCSIDRSALVKRYMPYANMLAAKYYAGRHIYEIEFEEFRQYAMIGLIESVDRYDPAYGAMFKTYAGHRIRGAILNGIEKYNEQQQQISVRSRLREERKKELMSQVNEEQQDPFARLVDTAIGLAIGYMLEDSGLFQTSEPGYEDNAYRQYELDELARLVRGLVDTLPEQERAVIRSHYIEQMRFDEIAVRMNLTKGRISQIHHRALKRMREHHQQQRLQRSDY